MIKIENKLPEEVKEITAEGWRIVSFLGYETVEIVDYNEDICTHLVAVNPVGEQVGILSFYTDTSIKGNEANIHLLYIKNRYRGKGIGKKLIKELVNHCENFDIESICTEFNIFNGIAAKFFYKNLYRESTDEYKAYRTRVEDLV